MLEPLSILFEVFYLSVAGIGPLCFQLQTLGGIQLALVSFLCSQNYLSRELLLAATSARFAEGIFKGYFVSLLCCYKCQVGQEELH